jgi:hypothetical protein
VDAIRRARELDPLSFRINRNVGQKLYFARRYDEALAELRLAADMQPNSSVVDSWSVKSDLKKGLADEAVAMDLRVRSERDGFNAESLNALRAANSKKGLLGYWRKLRELMLPTYSSSLDGSCYMAEIDTYLDNKEEAFSWLQKCYEGHGASMVWIKVDPSLDPLRSDARFKAILRRMRLAP